MKTRILALVLLLTASAFALTGCSGEEPFYSPGYWRDDTYYSAFMELRFQLPEGWEATDEEALTEMGAEADRALDLQRGGDGTDPASIYHYGLSATDPETGAGVLALVQENAANADTYLQSLQAGAEAEGAAYTAGDVSHVELAGRRYLALELTMEDAEAPYQRQYARKEGDYLILLMLFTPDQEAVPFSELEALFLPISSEE